MERIEDALERVAGALRAADFASVSIDPDDLDPNPVALWLQPTGIGDLTLAGGGTLHLALYLICGNAETRDALRLLDDALAGVLEVMGGGDLLSFADDDDPIDLRAAVLLPGYSQSLPAFRVALDTDLEETS